MAKETWDYSKWRGYASATATKSASAIYTSRDLNPDFNPAKILLRESCDSVEFPESTPAILALDVTGSMEPVLEVAIKKFGTLMEELLERKPITDPQIMSMGIGDVFMHDRAPLQVTQFEVDMTCVDQLAKVWLERGGGGNKSESYVLAWYFAALKTRCDSMLKRNKKGYLFTVGDEQPPPGLSADEIKKVFGESNSGNLTAREILTMAERSWNVFHVVVAQGNHVRYHGIESVLTPWRTLLGQRVIQLDNINDLPEVIVSTIQVNEGADKDTVVKSWTGTTSVVVRNAIAGLTATESADSELVRL